MGSIDFHIILTLEVNKGLIKIPFSLLTHGLTKKPTNIIQYHGGIMHTTLCRT